MNAKPLFVGAVIPVLLAMIAPAAPAQDLAASPAGPALGAAGRTEVGLRAGRERLSNGSPDWTDSSIEIAHRFERRKLILGSVTDSSRFGLKDTTTAIEGYYPFGARLTAYFAASASGTHHVLPRDTAYAQFGYALDGGWGALAGLKRSAYNTTIVQVLDLTLERYFSNYRAAFTVLPAHSQTAGNATSYRLALAYYYADESRVQLLTSKGTEVDRPTGVDLVLATPVRSTALFGRHWLSRSWALDYALSRTVQGTVNRNGINAGLRYRF